MRIKALLSLAALAACAITVSAQVYSANIVGYYNITVPASGYYLAANQLVAPDNTVAALFPTVPLYTTVIGWSEGAQQFAPNQNGDFGWDDPSMTLDVGQGFFIQNPDATPFTVTFVGEVKTDATAVAFTANNYKLCGLATPQAGLLQTDFGFTPGLYDQIILWSSAAQQYAPSTFDDFGWDAEPTLNVGDGWFALLATDQTWTRTFTPAP